MDDARFPPQHLSYGTLSQNMSKMQKVLPHLKQNLKNIFIQGIFLLIFLLNIVILNIFVVF